jgi:hypothetical protein
MECNEGRWKRPGEPKKEQGSGQKESKERQPLPNVWDVLERRVRLKDRPRGEEYEQEAIEVLELEDLKYTYGTPRDWLILNLYKEVRYTTGKKPYSHERYRRLSLDEFREFRSEIEKISDKELEKLLRPEPKEPKLLSSIVLGQPHIVFEDEDFYDN